MNKISELQIRLKRNPDGSAALTAIRADGSSTWQRQTGQLGNFFPIHDLTHYAVETALRYRHGFFGLIADGWEIKDFSPPFPRGRIPTEAREVEIVVSLIDNQRPDAASWTAEEFAKEAQLYVAARRSAGKESEDIRRFKDEELNQVRALRKQLLDRWMATKPGETLELAFDRAAAE